MKLQTRIFELSYWKYDSLIELAHVMGMSRSQVYRVRQGKRAINEKFIIGALKAFPGYRLDELFYVGQEEAEMPSDKRNELGRIIRQQRVMRGLTLNQLADVSGVSSSHLGCIEREEHFPSARTMRKIAKHLGFAESFTNT